MKILFFKDSSESGEMREVLGFTDATFTVEKLWPFLRSASSQIFKIIGKDNYAVCENIFHGNSDPELQEFYDMVRYAIALDAFRHHAPLTDISHTESGRLFRRDDHNVGAFEWQIQRNDDEMEKSYYKAVDEIISYIIQSDALDASDYMLQFSGLYVPDLDTFQKFVNIGDSHLLYYKLAPSLRLFEQREIMNRLGSKFSDFKGKKDDIINTLIQNACVYFAMADGIQKLSVQLFPEGLMKAEKFGKKTATGYDKETISLYYRNELASILKMLETEVKKLNKVIVSGPVINFRKEDGFVSM